MSGHSKWANIKHKKEKLDKQRGKTFSKVSKIIINAAREGGSDVNQNLTLKLAVDQAKAANMPKDVIQRAIDRGVGKSADGRQFEEVLYEAYGPHSIPILISILTDSKNRSLAELREALSDHGGRLADVGSVKWQFDQTGLIQVKSAKMKTAEKFGQANYEVPVDPDEATLEMLELSNIDDIKSVAEDDETILHVTVPFTQLAPTTKAIRAAGYVVNTAGVHYHYNQATRYESNESLTNLLTALDNLDDVQDYWYPHG